MAELVHVRDPQPVALPLSDIQRMAQAVASSGLFGVKSPDQALALMLIAQAEGLHPAIAARDYDIIQGRPAKKSEAMLRSFIANGGRVKWGKLDDSCAEATFAHPAGGEITIRWDMERAKIAGLTGKDMYRKYPRQMLRARCISEGVRTVCPMATSGMYVPEEVADMEPTAAAAPTSRTGKEVLADAHAVEQSPEREALMQSLHDSALAGTEALQAAWHGLTAEQRKTVGTAGLNDLKALAAQGQSDE